MVSKQLRLPPHIWVEGLRRDGGTDGRMDIIEYLGIYFLFIFLPSSSFNLFLYLFRFLYPNYTPAGCCCLLSILLLLLLL
jgi:hypothetical protein